MRISQLPDLPSSAPTVEVPCTYNGVDYKTEITANAPALPIYQSGDQITGYLYCYGYVTSDSQSVYITMPLPKVLQSGASVSITSLTGSIRTVNGGYLESANGANLTSRVASVTAQGTALIIGLSKSSAFTYGSGGTPSGNVTNNTPLAGYVSISATVI